MCFVKTKMPKVETTETVNQETVKRKEADASLTKSTNNTQEVNKNIKTTPFGLEELAKTEKKTLLGE